MTIEFDPRNRARNVGVPESNEPRSQSADPLETLTNPQTYVSEMELLFSGARRLEQLRQENPMEPIDVPDLGDLLNSLPSLGNSSSNMSDIIDRYTLLRRNLIERRSNYAHALERTLSPEETLDLYARLEQIEDAILKAEQELQKSIHRKEELERRERLEAEARAREELDDLEDMEDMGS